MSDNGASDDMSALTEDGGHTSSEGSSLASSSYQNDDGKKPTIEIEPVESDREVWPDDKIAVELGDFVLFKQAHKTIETFFALYCKRTQHYQRKSEVDGSGSSTLTEEPVKHEFLFESIKDIMFSSKCWFDRNIPRSKLTFQSIASHLPVFKNHIDKIDVNSILRKVFFLSDRDLMSAESDEEEKRLLAECDKSEDEKGDKQNVVEENSGDKSAGGKSSAPGDQKSGKRRPKTKTKSAQSHDETQTRPRSSRRSAVKPIARFADEQQQKQPSKKKVAEPAVEIQKQPAVSAVAKKKPALGSSGNSNRTSFPVKKTEVINLQDDEAYEDYQSYPPWTPTEDVESRYDPRTGREKRLSGKPQPADVEAVLRKKFAEQQQLLVETLQQKLQENEAALKSLSRAGSLQSQQSEAASVTNGSKSKRRSQNSGGAAARSRSASPPNDSDFSSMMFGGAYPGGFPAARHHPAGMYPPQLHHHAPYGYYPPPPPPPSAIAMDPNFALMLSNQSQAYYFASMGRNKR